MGDTGSLSLGGSLLIGIITKHEIVLQLQEAFCFGSSISNGQNSSFKWTGKRVFKMAPIHVTLKKRLARSTVVIRFG